MSTEAGQPDILLNDFKRQWADTSAAVLEAVARVGASGWYVLGGEVQQFEEDLARAFRGFAAPQGERQEPPEGVGQAIGCASGLDAIELALRALALSPGAKVLTTPLSAFATTLAIVRAGCVPVFVDVDAFGLLDLGACERALAEDPSIRALVPVHLFGHALDLGRLAALRQRFGAAIVEDCAQSIGATFEGRPAGTVGQLAATSFYPTKNLGALGDGGAVLTSDAALAARCRTLRDYGQSKKYVHDALGLNSRLDELHAGILRTAFLPRLARWTARRREIAASYCAQLDNPRVRVPGAPAGSQSVWHLFPVLVEASARDGFMGYLQQHGVRSGIHYPHLIQAQRALAGVPFEVRGALPRAEEYAACEVSLPIHPYLGPAEVARVVAAVNRWTSP